MRIVKTAPGPFVVLLLFSACDPVVTSDYRGEPVFTVRGSLVGDASAAPALDLVIAWLSVTTLTREPSGAVTLDVDRLAIQTKTDVAGSFPAQFELSIYEPPPFLIDASIVGGDAQLSSIIGDNGFAMGSVLVIDARRPPQLDHAELVDAAFGTGPMPERVYGIATATVFYTEGFAFGPGEFLPGGIAQAAPGFIVVEPLAGAMARTWASFGELRDDLYGGDGYATRWAACVEACVGTDDAWLDGKGCGSDPVSVGGGGGAGATISQAACIACEVDCALDNGVEALDEYAAARAACDAACADEQQPAAATCLDACRALDPIVLANFPGDPVVIEGDELLRIELREPGE